MFVPEGAGEGGAKLLDDSHWASFHRHWNRLKPPQRPHRDVAVALGKLIAEDGHADRVLLLGVTPELAPLGRRLVAVDRNQTMIDHIWPGDRDDRQAIKGDWLALPFPPASFAAVIGDGSCNCLAYPDAYRELFAEIGRVTRPGGAYRDPRLSGARPARDCPGPAGGGSVGTSRLLPRLQMAVRPGPACGSRRCQCEGRSHPRGLRPRVPRQARPCPSQRLEHGRHRDRRFLQGIGRGL